MQVPPFSLIFKWGFQVDGAQHSLCFSFQDGGDPGNVIWLRRTSCFSDTLVVYQDIREVSSSGLLVVRLLAKARLMGGWVWVSFTVTNLEISEVRMACGTRTHPASFFTKLMLLPFACWVPHVLGLSTLKPLPFKCFRRVITWNVCLS